MSQDSEYEGELTGSREEIASVLSGVAEGIRTGAVRIGNGPDSVTVDTPDELTLEIELETEDGERSLELELEWSVSEEASGAVGDASEPASEDASGGASGDAAGVSPIDVSPEDEGSETKPEGDPEAPQSLARFEVYRARDEEWRWRLRHRNGNIIATSGEGYTRKHNAVKGLRSVMKNSTGAAITGEFPE